MNDIDQVSVTVVSVTVKKEDIKAGRFELLKKAIEILGEKVNAVKDEDGMQVKDLEIKSLGEVYSVVVTLEEGDSRKAELAGIDCVW